MEDTLVDRSNLKLGLIAIIGMGFSVNASATDLTCSDITFSPEAYSTYEFVDQACLEMVDRGGKTYAKLSARVVAQSRIGTDLRFLNQDGSRGPAHRSQLPSDFETMLAGKAVKMEDLAVRQDINIYIADKYWTVNQVAAPEPVAAAAPPPPPPAPEPEPEPEVLPTTASSVPLLALFGSLFLIIGGVLRFSRRQ